MMIAMDKIEVTAEKLKGLAHPLRSKMFTMLSNKGPATATQLAQALGESSGATSYHLRQLAKYGLIEEDPRDDNAKERWWRRTPGAVNVSPPKSGESPAGKAQRELYYRLWQQERNAMILDFFANGEQENSPEWIQSSSLSSRALWLTREELSELSNELNQTLDRWQEGRANRPSSAEAGASDDPEAQQKRVVVYLDSFPINAEYSLPNNPSPDGEKRMRNTRG